MNDDKKLEHESNHKPSDKKDDNVEIKKVEKLDNNSSKKGDKIKVEEKGSEKSQTVVVKGKKKKKAVPFLKGNRGQVHVKASYNNTIVSITDLKGNLLLWSSAGKCGFKGPKKATPYAAGVIVRTLVDKIKALGIKEVDVFVKGVGPGREATIRAFDTQGVHVISIKDVTPIPHGGCRPPKRRRV